MMRDSDLKDISIPGDHERLIANLFADDTTTFLAADDHLDTLQDILDTWCIASRAKFNTAKTKIIPIETQEYHTQVISSHITRPSDMSIFGSA